MKSAMPYAVAAVALAAVVACAPSPAPTPSPEASASPAAAPTPAGPAAFTASADVHPFTIGAFQAASLRDGYLEVPNDNKTLAINKKKADVDTVLKAANLPTDKLQLSVQPLIVRAGDKTLLFDTGAGGLFGPTVGKLPASLAAGGGDPAAVTDIFISHAHGDHVGGLAKDGAPAFPNAAIHISAPEWAYLKTQKNMAAIVAAITPKVVEFQPGADVVDGVKAVEIKGHTPGHSGYLITSGDQSLLYQGDVMHHSVISVQQPDWTIAFDGDAPLAQLSRKAMLELWATSGQRIYAVHFPFPGLGKYVKSGDHMVWMAEK